MSIVEYELLPELTSAQRDELKLLAQKSDEHIDLSDIPELDETFWQNAKRGALYKPTKQTTTVRVDSDVLIWLKSKGKGYQTRLNQIVRKAMLDELRH
jgi:uncharacterized protein (DUF4415 family)